MPWESLYDPPSPTLRRRPVHCPRRVANHVGYTGRARPLAAQLPLKILIVAIDDPDGLDAAAEMAAVEHVLAPLRPHQIDLHTDSGRFDIHALRRRLLDVQPDVLHLITHGDPDGLLFWSTDGDPTFVTGAQIQATLRQIDSLKLVFLNACLAGQPDDNTSYAAVAERLLQTGLPAVIAMQYEIADQAAVHFAGFLYEALVGGTCPGAVDHAVGIARSNLYIDAPHRLGYITPVLWLNTEDGLIFHLAQQGALPAQTAAPNHPTADEDPASLPPPPRIDMNLAEKEAWLAAHPGYQRDRLSFDARIVYDSRRSALADAQRVLDELRLYDAEQADGHALPAPIQRALERFAHLRREADRLTQILVTNVGPGDE
ncbi:MAG: CHAT domain-containing protein [Caldilineaceae bacterium]